jgi:methionyl-tRNA formyltransferase
MRLIYFTGGPRERILEALLDAGHAIEAVYANSPDRFPCVAPSIEFARRRNLRVRIVERKRDLTALAPEVSGRLILSAGFRYILPSELIKSAQLILNVHGTLLPNYAGARTLGWVIVNGEKQSGVTVHKVDTGVDTGPILLQRAFDLDPLETTESLAKRTYAMEPNVVLDALALVEAGKHIFTPQSHVGIKRWPDRTPADAEIDPTKPLLASLAVILASDPRHYPAHFLIDGRKVCITVWYSEQPPEQAS